MIKLYLLYVCLSTFLQQITAQYGVSPSVSDSVSTHCDRLITQSEQWILSPNYPNDYGPSRLCIYTLPRIGSDVCKVELLLTHFQLPRNNRCEDDFLELSDGQRLCGNLPINSRRVLDFPTDWDNLRLRLVSSSIVPVEQRIPRGFIINFKHVRNSCNNTLTSSENGYQSYGQTDWPNHVLTRTLSGHEFESGSYSPNLITARLSGSCSHHLHTYSGNIKSPSFPFPYPTNSFCMYLFRRPAVSVCKIKLYLRTFDVNSGSISNFQTVSRNGSSTATDRCQFGDYLELSDGSRLCSRLSSETFILKYSESSDFLPLHFRSDSSGAATGFDIEFQQLANSCEQIHPLSPSKCDQHIKSETRLTSPGYPSAYSPNRVCIYTLEQLSAAICGFSLRIHKLSLENARDRFGICINDYLQLPDGVRLCGNVTGTKIYSFNTLQNSRFHKHPLLLFKSNAKNEDAGFDLQFTQIRCLSDFFRDSSENSQVLSTSDIGGGVQLNFPRNFSLFVPSSPKITLLQNPILTATHVENRSRFQTLTPTITVAIPATPPKPINRISCDRMFTAKTGILTSPKYPRDYPANLDCLYTLYPSGTDVCRVRLRFLNFDVERSYQCRSDYLLVQNTGEKLCGQQLHIQDKVLDFPSPAGSVALQFVSDAELGFSGFEVKIEQIANSCPDNSRQSRTFDWPTFSSGSNVNAGHIFPAGFHRRFGWGSEPPNLNLPLCGSSAKTEFTFDSPNFPLTYSPSTDCIYRVYRANERICALEMTFTEFAVGSGGDLQHCPNDFLEINAHRYCGFRKGERLRLPWPFSVPQLNMRFFADATEQMLGFRLNARQLQGKECRNVEDSGSEPVGSYGSGLTAAVYNGALAPSAYGVYSGSNGYDGLSNYGPLRSGINSYGTPSSGSLKPVFSPSSNMNGWSTATAAASNNQMSTAENLHYFNQKAGFGIGSSCPTIEHREQRFRIHSPGYGQHHYQANLNCVFRIWKTLSEVCALRFTFHDLRLQPSSGCRKDSLVLGSHRFCGHLPRDSIRTYEFSTDSADIVFKTDEETGDFGFEITIEQVIC